MSDDVGKYFSPLGRTYLTVDSASWLRKYRDQANEKANELGSGLVMELGSTTTRFYADPNVEVGKIMIYAPRAYKAMSEYVTTIDADEDWTPEAWKATL